MGNNENNKTQAQELKTEEFISENASKCLGGEATEEKAVKKEENSRTFDDFLNDLQELAVDQEMDVIEQLYKNALYYYNLGDDSAKKLRKYCELKEKAKSAAMDYFTRRDKEDIPPELELYRVYGDSLRHEIMECNQSDSEVNK